MVKLNKHYQSMYNALLRFNFPFMETIDKLLYEGKTKNNWTNRRMQMEGSFQPLLDVGKDFIDTFKPYRSSWYVRRDLLQPFYGLANILKGIAYLLAIIPAFFLLLGRNILYFSGTDFLHDFSVTSVRTLSWLIEGILNIVRGTTQFATTPLTWFFKMPLRKIIKACTDKTELYAEHRPGIRKLAAEASECLITNEDWVGAHEKLEEIHRKYLKAIATDERSEDTKIKFQEITIQKNLFLSTSRSIKKGTVCNYLALFAKDKIKGFKNEIEQKNQQKEEAVSFTNYFVKK